ncbi:LacI family transcriptional regulator [Actinomadura rupiterrae]|nr:LacI family transcriptional regulator [Actinomadura rupiterrae]
MVTMREVAERAGVTKQTVSNVVTGRVRVRPETEARVRAAIAELGYTPNLVARSLATGASRTVGLFVPTVTNAFYSEVVEEAENVLEEHGYHLLLCTTRQDASRAARHMASLASRSVDALLIAGDEGLDDHLPLLADARFPIALCAWETEIPSSLPVVTIDYEQAGHLAGRHLRDLGHERVAVVASLPAHADRLDGFRHAFERDGLTVPDEMVFPVTDPTAAGGFAAATRALRAHPELTAVFATYDVLAIGALDAARTLGRAVPGSLSVIGHDDVDEARHVHPSLTTVAIPSRAMARQAIELLLHAIENDRPPVNSLQLLRPTLVPRDSTAPAPSL